MTLPPSPTSKVKCILYKCIHKTRFWIHIFVIKEERGGVLIPITNYILVLTNQSTDQFMNPEYRQIFCNTQVKTPLLKYHMAWYVMAWHGMETKRGSLLLVLFCRA